ncbi:MAG: twin transmembrane helix small protein [Motiliproteus sp.]
MLKILLLIVFVAIVISLLAALYFLISAPQYDQTEQNDLPEQTDHRTVNALAVRVLLSLLLVGLLLFGLFSGQL